MATKEELIKQWLFAGVVTNSQEKIVRDKLFSDLYAKGLYPDNIDYENKYGLYPDIEDENFLVKLFHKQEFAENKFKSIEDLTTCDGSVEFQLSPVQRFISNYLSGKTPYYSALLYHGTGVGKTCAAIASAEAYLHILEF